MDDLVERLTDEATRLSGRSIERGCVDSGLASNLAQEAAGRIEKLEAENARLREAYLKCSNRASALNPNNGDDDGQ